MSYNFIAMHPTLESAAMMKAACFSLTKNTVLAELVLTGNHFDKEIFEMLKKLQDYRKNSGGSALIIDISERGPKATVTKILETNMALAKKNKKGKGKKKGKKK